MSRILVRAMRLPAAALYLAAVAGVPIAHAQTEVVCADPAVEAGHSGDCQILHVEGVCAVTGVAKMQAALRQVRAHPVEAEYPPVGAVAEFRSTPSPLSAISERGPPERPS